MTLNQKIADVLCQINKQRKLTLNGEFIRFDFMFVAGAGIYHTSQKEILLKLEEQKVLVLHRASIQISENDNIVTSNTIKDFMNESEFIYVEILPKFNIKYWQYLIYNTNKNYWKILHPVYWLFLIISNLIKLIWKFKIISILITVIFLLAIDFSLAWQNTKAFLLFLGINI